MLSCHRMNHPKNEVAATMESYLASEDFEHCLSENLSKTLRGAGSSNIPQEMLLQVISLTHTAIPQPLKKDIPVPDEAFILQALQVSTTARRDERHRGSSSSSSGQSWELSEVPDLIAVVFINLAMTVDQFRALGGKEIDANALAAKGL